MRPFRASGLWLAGLATLVVLAWQLQSSAQPVATKPANSNGKFEFDVIESFNAKYLGDTPGHTGRGGKLDEVRPNVALGDPVYRGEKQIGVVSALIWDRTRGSLDVEFDPLPTARVGVGERVWVWLDGSNHVKSGE